MALDVIAGAIGFVLTLMVLSYVIGDNAAFRVAVHVFVGVAAGYVAAVAFWHVLWPDLLSPLVSGTPETRASLAIPLALSGLMLMKILPSLTRLGSPAMGLLVGAASAVAIGGAVQGTLFPQAYATVEVFGPLNASSFEGLLNAAVIMAGVVASLAYFHFSARVRSDGSVARPALLEIVAGIGGIFLAITLGVLFAGVYSAALTALIERLRFMGSFLGLS